MSRSRKRNPIHGNTCAESDKRDKQLSHKRYRKAVREAIERGDEVIPDEDKMISNWTFDKDGKSYWHDGDGIAKEKPWRRTMK